MIGGELFMFENLLHRKGLLLIFFALGLLYWGASAAQASDAISLHVLFTGNVGGRVEPSG
jgi:hypothetical protein